MDDGTQINTAASATDAAKRCCQYVGLVTAHTTALAKTEVTTFNTTLGWPKAKDTYVKVCASDYAT